MSLVHDLRALGWSGSALARRFGVTPGVAIDWVNGRATPPPVIVDYVAACRVAVETVPVPPFVRRIGSRFQPGNRFGRIPT